MEGNASRIKDQTDRTSDKVTKESMKSQASN
jgi:hypothetical protein